MLKRILSVFLCVLVALSVTACGGEKNPQKDKDNTTDSAQKLKTISMLYCRGDSFNPYTALSDINRQLCRLIYEPLIKTDNQFNPVYRLAERVDFGDKSCTVVLKSASFSDGTPVTAKDVVFSFEKAKVSGTAYASKLYEIASAEAVDSKTVLFTLTRNDPYFENLLDFPILKTDSDIVTDSDGILQPPIGCGRYILSRDKTYLYLNKTFFGKRSKIEKINLIDTPDRDAVAHYVEVGAVSFYYANLSDGNIVRMSGKKAEINLNNFVYIGINSKYSELNDKYMRYALSSAVSRKDVCANAYHNYATPAQGFFNSAFTPVNSVQSLSNEANIKITVENLDKIGYNSVDSEGYRINSKGRRVSLNLLVNSENLSRVLAAQEIAKAMKAAGIEITVVQKSYDLYLADLAAGNFQLYLGETSILPNMDLSPLVLKGGAIAFGVGNEPQPEVSNSAQQGAAVANPIEIAVTDFYEGKISINDVAAVLLTEMPQIPICYRKSLLFYSEDFSGVEASQSDIYLTIESYSK